MVQMNPQILAIICEITKPFVSHRKALEENLDIDSATEVVEVEAHRVMVADTDDGILIRERIADLQELLEAYRSGLLIES